MAQQTWAGSDKAKDVLASDGPIDGNFDDLYASKAELEAARDGEPNLLAQIDALQAAILAVTAANGSLVSSNDTTPGFLNGKLLAGTGITLTEGNDGGDETLTIASGNTVLAKTTDTLSTTEVNGSYCITNTGSVAESILTWPTLAAGQSCKFYVDVAQYQQVKVPAGSTIRFRDKISVDAGYIRSNVEGDWIELLAISTTELVALWYGGTGWLLETS